MNGHEYYFITADLAPEHRQVQFYPEEENEMDAWIKAYRRKGWTVTIRPMNFTKEYGA